MLTDMKGSWWQITKFGFYNCFKGLAKSETYRAKLFYKVFMLILPYP